MNCIRRGKVAARSATGAAIRVTARAGLEGCAMLGDRTQLDRPPWPPMHIQSRNSIALRLALVADASADAAVSLSAKRDWDLAAADIIVREAGGCVTDLARQRRCATTARRRSSPA